MNCNQQKVGKNTIFGSLIAIFISSSMVSIVAQEGLYDPAPPANSAFVRLYNNTENSIEATLDTKIYKDASKNATAYLIIPEGNRSLLFEKSVNNFLIKSGKFYTIVISKNQISILEDANNTNRTKSLISLYNLSSSNNLTLKTLDGKTNVIENVGGNSSKSVVVNGIKIGFSVFSENKSVANLPEKQLERSTAYSIFVTSSKEGFQASLVKATTIVK